MRVVLPIVPLVHPKMFLTCYLGMNYGIWTCGANLNLNFLTPLFNLRQHGLAEFDAYFE